MDLKTNIKFWLSEKRMTAKELCSQINMTESNLQSIYRSNNTDLKNLTQIADTLGVSVIDLIIGDQGETNNTEVESLTAQIQECKKDKEIAHKLINQITIENTGLGNKVKIYQAIYDSMIEKSLIESEEFGRMEHEAIQKLHDMGQLANPPAMTDPMIVSKMITSLKDISNFWR